MNHAQKSSAIPELTQAWTTLQGYAPLRQIRSETDYLRMRELTDLLADSAADDEDHPLFSLFEIAMDLIARWEEQNVLIPAAAPAEVLRFLLTEHGLKQKDLSDIASETLVSDILAGRRAISKRLAKALSARFHVDIAAFIA